MTSSPGDATGQQRFDVIVIGSGIGGLTAGLTVASRGRSVLVLEGGKQLGGYLNPFRRGSFSFDPGLHYLGECGPGQAFSNILGALDLSDEITFRELSPGGFDRLVFPGYEVSMPRGAEAYHARLARDFPDERGGLELFFAELARFREATLAFDDLDGVGALPSGAVEPSFLSRYVRATMRDIIDPLIRDPLLRAVLSAQGGDYALPPSRASAIIGLGVLDHYLRGAYFPRGGSGALRDAFVSAIGRRGGVMRRNRRVARILLRRGRVEGVRCEDGEEFLAPTVISNVDAAVTYRELVGEANLPPRLRRKTQDTRYSLSSICLFVGTDLDVAAAGMTDANIWNYPSTDLEGCYAPTADWMPPAEHFFLSSPSLKDPEGTGNMPRGHHTLELVTLVAFEPFAAWAGMRSMRRGADYEELKVRLGERYLGAMERYVPGVSGRIRALEISTPVTNLSYASAPRGAIYGPEQSPDQCGPFRHAVRGAIPGLFLCGASTLGAGVVPAAMSGFAAGNAATGVRVSIFGPSSSGERRSDPTWGA
jgi:all-trans-retinol 13,14-reductase